MTRQNQPTDVEIARYMLTHYTPATFHWRALYDYVGELLLNDHANIHNTGDRVFNIVISAFLTTYDMNVSPSVFYARATLLSEPIPSECDSETHWVESNYEPVREDVIRNGFTLPDEFLDEYSQVVRSDFVLRYTLKEVTA